jgi:hypothetical protein
MLLAKSNRVAAAYTGYPTKSEPVRAGMDAARRGDFASEEEMDEFYRLHHRV